MIIGEAIVAVGVSVSAVLAVFRLDVFEEGEGKVLLPRPEHRQRELFDCFTSSCAVESVLIPDHHERRRKTRLRGPLTVATVRSSPCSRPGPGVRRESSLALSFTLVPVRQPSSFKLNRVDAALDGSGTETRRGGSLDDMIHEAECTNGRWQVKDSPQNPWSFRSQPFHDRRAMGRRPRQYLSAQSLRRYCPCNACGSRMTARFPRRVSGSRNSRSSVTRRSSPNGRTATRRSIRPFSSATSAAARAAQAIGTPAHRRLSPPPRDLSVSPQRFLLSTTDQSL